MSLSGAKTSKSPNEARQGSEKQAKSRYVTVALLFVFVRDR